MHFCGLGSLLLTKDFLQFWGGALILLAMISALSRLWTERNALAAVFLLFTLCLLMREWNFGFMYKGVYWGLGLVALLALAFSGSIRDDCRRGAFMPFMLAAIWIYFFSHVVVEGGLLGPKGMAILPLERTLNLAFEEASENFAHLLLALAGFSGLHDVKRKIPSYVLAK